MGKLGTDKIKKALALAFAFGKQTATALEDHKITLSDLFGYVDEITQVQGVINDGSEIASQVVDLDAQESAEIETWATTQDFGISKADVKEKVTAGLGWVEATVRNYVVWTKKPSTTDGK